MESYDALACLGALSQSTRLETFRLLVRHEPDGLPAGEVARQLDVPQNTMSTHLAVLTRAGLLRSERLSRSIVYRADLERLREMMLFLVRDCCGGRADLCQPLIADLLPCCPQEKAVP
ncbi:Transcriptional regulator, ArsR family [Roseomonas mucosa]|jgi:DNA-binding transcriptional ArsR family regulator|uniref:Helix-turn-helix domain n=3 Tax=Roseomonas TaxID=125216 RepID=A0A379N262_9PROT|nr:MULTISPECIES: metalloregulator ArsR/SmtB family transcription factor [Acetobacteraceae]MBS5905160.1 helix-turn-helix transcriptional regulator [Acetobacteraceae bacterium]PZP46552.1 MAG: ArsR family transcriptional regulator [Azospirillum brasilense]HWL81610.1 metalloregulator ArsR/SmtB family transcription factor [Roseomonas sp.]APT57317.1 transcriptional regulator [Roseomonas gilardii]ATR20237.1 ArsR family transcriptional regulator [Roseomonas sp. FDAARGOS_362]